jgi:hypothetical protein
MFAGFYFYPTSFEGVRDCVAADGFELCSLVVGYAATRVHLHQNSQRFEEEWEWDLALDFRGLFDQSEQNHNS